MDRLSAYAERESESEPTEDRIKSEEDATARLLEKLRISKEGKASEATADKTEPEQTNGEHTNGKPVEPSPQDADGEAKSKADSPTNHDAEKPPSKNRGIPEDVKLYEIFYGQVTHLVHAQRLPIQDTVALLVSLSNLAL